MGPRRKVLKTIPLSSATVLATLESKPIQSPQATHNSPTSRQPGTFLSSRASTPPLRTMAQIDNNNLGASDSDGADDFVIEDGEASDGDGDFAFLSMLPRPRNVDDLPHRELLDLRAATIADLKQKLMNRYDPVVVVQVTLSFNAPIVARRAESGEGAEGLPFQFSGCVDP